MPPDPHHEAHRWFDFLGYHFCEAPQSQHRQGCDLDDWERGPAIDLGFVHSTPAWRSPDIAILKPGEFPEDGTFTFPEEQDMEANETFHAPAAGEKALNHKVAVRVWNFGDVDALNVQVELVLRCPAAATGTTRRCARSHISTARKSSRGSVRHAHAGVASAAVRENP